MFTHVIWCWGVGSISLICFYNKTINFIVLYFCIVLGVYNGATYIFEYMVKHYEKAIRTPGFIENPEQIISFDFGVLMESIGSGRSAFAMPQTAD